MLALLLQCQVLHAELQYILQISSIKLTTTTTGCENPIAASLRFNSANVVPLSDFCFNETQTFYLTPAQFSAVYGTIAPVLEADGQNYPISTITSRSFDIEVCFDDIVLMVQWGSASVTVQEHCSLNSSTQYFLLMEEQVVALTQLSLTQFETNAFNFDNWQVQNVYFVAVTGNNQSYFMNLITSKHALQIAQSINIYWNTDKIIVGLSLTHFHDIVDVSLYTELEIVYQQQLTNYQSVVFRQKISDLHASWSEIIAFYDQDETITRSKDFLQPRGMLYLNYLGPNDQETYSQYCSVFLTTVHDIELGVGLGEVRLTILAEKAVQTTSCKLVLVSNLDDPLNYKMETIDLPDWRFEPLIYSIQAASVDQARLEDYYRFTVRRKKTGMTVLECPSFLQYIDQVYSYRQPSLWPFLGIALFVATLLGPAIWLYFYYLPKQQEKRQLELLDEQIRRKELEQARLALEGAPRQQLFFKDQMPPPMAKKPFTDVETVTGIQDSGRRRAAFGSENLQSIGEADHAAAAQPGQMNDVDIDAEFEELERQLDEMKDGQLEDQDIE